MYIYIYNNVFSRLLKTAPGSVVALDKWLVQKMCVLKCPMQRSCPGQDLFNQHVRIFEHMHQTRSCPRHMTCQALSEFWKETIAPCSAVPQTGDFLGKQRKTNRMSEVQSVSGRAVARDRWLVQKRKTRISILKQRRPRQRSCPRQVTRSKTRGTYL